MSNDQERRKVAEAERYLPSSGTLDEAQSAYDAWGANCGPGALAAVLGTTLEDVRPHIPLFDKRRYTSPSMMLHALRSLGLVRVQWSGPWMKPGVPIKARYRHTHWIASRLCDSDTYVFDINGACVGWMPRDEWTNQLAPWLLKQIAPRNDGTWTITHRLELAA